jgi:uncharacterized protein (DUF2141 family)
MTNLFFLIFLSGIISMTLPQDLNENTGNIYLYVDGFENNDGKLMIALANSENSYSQQGQEFRGANTQINSKKAEYVFKDIPVGVYAIKVFHDKNNNDELDFNFMHIPQEAYGFSNNARGTFGPASWEEAKFDLKSDSTVIQITVK